MGSPWPGCATARCATAPVTVLGFARSGIALARFFADAGARVTVYDARPAPELDEAIAAIGDRPVRLALGPAVDPASTWADADLVTTSPSIHPDYPTTEPRLRAALVELRGSVAPPERRCRPSSARSTSSCGSAPRRRSA